MMPTPTDDTALLPVALRDTALTATLLAGHATPPSFEGFRRKCREQVERLRTELISAGHASDIVEDAAYAQCALLDEAALSNLTGPDRDAWEHEPLQVSEFQSHDAGEQLIARIERRLAQPQPVLPLLAIFQAVLNHGFKGKFTLEGVDARTALMTAIDKRLGCVTGLDDMSGTVLVRPGTRHRWYGRLSAFAWLVIACAAAGVVYLALDQWLAASIARLAH